MLMAEGLSTSPLVFPDVDGSYQRRSGLFRHHYKAILKKAGLPTIRFQDLRQSCATLFLGMATHPKIRSGTLGHSTIGITIDTYSHVTPSMQREAVGKLDLLFKKASG